MATETTVIDNAPDEDAREVRQERRFGTVDLDASGEATVDVDLTGELHTLGTGLMTNARVGDGSVAVANLAAGSLDLNVTGGTADQENVEWEVVVSEDGFYRDSGESLSGGTAP